MAMSLALSVLLNDVVRRSLWEREEEIYGSNGKIYVEAMERTMACRETVSLHTDSSSALWSNLQREAPSRLSSEIKENRHPRQHNHHQLLHCRIDDEVDDNAVVQDRRALLSLMKSCGKEKDLMRARRIHNHLLQKGLFSKDVYVETGLLSMYAKCGCLNEAQEVFDELSTRTIVSWNALISGYAQNGLGEKALSCFQKLRDEGFTPDAVTFVCILKACSSIRYLEMGEEIRTEITKNGLLSKDTMLQTALVDMYAKCGMIEKSREIFDELPIRSVVSWNALISGYINQGLANEALKCFAQMCDEGLSPDQVTYICILKACGLAQSLSLGEEIHAEIRKQNLLEKNVILGNALVDMYVKCSMLEKAQEVLNKLPRRNVISWSTLIAGYAQHGLGDKALNCWRKMKHEGLLPNALTFIFILKACGSIGSREIGEEIHMQVSKQGLLKKDIMLATTLLDMYVKFSMLGKAQQVFDDIPIRDVVSWNALIAGYAQHGLSDEALECFRNMQGEGLCPDTVTLICILKACGNIGYLGMGDEIYSQVLEQRLLGKDIALGTAIVDMYVKCGLLEKAQKVFNGLAIQNAVAWNALMAGYAQLGHPKRVWGLFRIMVSEGVVADVVTFLVLLSACSHAGLVKEGDLIFHYMDEVYDLNPTLEHYTCMVDTFSRAGHFDKALTIIEEVPSSDRLSLWSALLGACCRTINVELARWAFEQSVLLNAKGAALYIYMANVYVAAGMREEAENIEAWRLKNNAWEDEGFVSRVMSLVDYG